MAWEWERKGETGRKVTVKGGLPIEALVASDVRARPITRPVRGHVDANQVINRVAWQSHARAYGEENCGFL